MNRAKAERIVAYLDAALTALADITVVQDKIGQAIAALEVDMALGEDGDPEELDFNDDAVWRPLHEDGAWDDE